MSLPCHNYIMYHHPVRAKHTAVYYYINKCMLLLSLSLSLSHIHLQYHTLLFPLDLYKIPEICVDFPLYI